MQRDNTIKTNDELYGNAQPPPLDYIAVQWRVDFFKDKVIENMDGDPSVLNQYVKHRDFWIEIRDKHCEKVKQ